jgi:16S rRNA (cytidine1402-2'-O)-methyltransferase
VTAGTLYLVATPIGNLGDITHRAVDVLRAVPRIAAEDTRHTHKLLSHFGIEGKKLDALHAHSSDKDVARLVDKLLAGEDVALVTDAGTPQVSDPGDALVRAALTAGVVVVPLPGPSAVLAALSASGLGTGGGFRFVAFLPRDGTARREAIGRVCDEADPVVLFEAPNRLTETLTDLAAATPARPACIAREITKLHEEFLRGTLAELAALERDWMGEVVVVLGAHDPASRATVIDDDAIDARIDDELAKGAHAKGLAERLAAWSGRPKREIYERVLTRKAR